MAPAVLGFAAALAVSCTLPAEVDTAAGEHDLLPASLARSAWLAQATPVPECAERHTEAWRRPDCTVLCRPVPGRSSVEPREASFCFC